MEYIRKKYKDKRLSYNLILPHWCVILMPREAVYVQEGMVCGNSAISTQNFGVNLKLLWRRKPINFFNPIILFAVYVSFL